MSGEYCPWCWDIVLGVRSIVLVAGSLFMPSTCQAALVGRVLRIYVRLVIVLSGVGRSSTRSSSAAIRNNTILTIDFSIASISIFHNY